MKRLLTGIAIVLFAVLLLPACAGMHSKSSGKAAVPEPGQNANPVTAAPAEKPGIPPDHIMIQSQLIVLPKGVYGTLHPELRKLIQSGRPVSQPVVDALLVNSRARLLGSPRWYAKYGEIGAFGVQTYSPKTVVTAEPLAFVMIAIDCIPFLNPDKTVTLYSVMSFISNDQESNIHGSEKRVVTPESGKYQYYRYGNSAEDVLVFMEILTKESLGK